MEGGGVLPTGRWPSLLHHRGVHVHAVGVISTVTRGSHSNASTGPAPDVHHRGVHVHAVGVISTVTRGSHSNASTGPAPDVRGWDHTLRITVGQPTLAVKVDPIPSPPGHNEVSGWDHTLRITVGQPTLAVKVDPIPSPPGHNEVSVHLLT